MAVKKNFYAVRCGRQPGIYKTWTDCQKQIMGFKGAVYKGFPTQAEAESFMSGAEKKKTILDNDEIKIYVDGSFDGKRYGWGFAVFQAGELICSEKGAGDNPDYVQHRNVAGEVFAAAYAARWARGQGLKSVTICHDYQGISEWAEGRWKTNTPMTQRYAAFMKDYRDIIKFQKVTGHSGVDGNELADKLARQAIGL